MDTSITLHTEASLLKAITARAMQEIIEDMQSGRVPETVRDFATLHDFVDANEYGGLCDGSWDAAAELVYGDGGIFSEKGMAAINKMQDAVDEWLRLEIKA